MATFLRELYNVLDGFSTATHTAMCRDMLRKLTMGRRKQGNLAVHFSNALMENLHFSQVSVPFIPDSRDNDDGTNPVTKAMANASPITITISPEMNHEFKYVNREVPHLRAATEMEEHAGAWIDYVAHSKNRPILGEIKWEDDKNSFYAFIQLLTYLSEIATPRQIERSLKHNLFGDCFTALTAFDLHIFLCNFNDRGMKGPLIELTHELASAFKYRLQNDHPDASACLGNVFCISGTIGGQGNMFDSVPKCNWMV